MAVLTRAAAAFALVSGVIVLPTAQNESDGDAVAKAQAEAALIAAFGLNVSNLTDAALDDAQIQGAESEEENPEGESVIYYFTSQEKCENGESGFTTPSYTIKQKLNVEADCSSCIETEGVTKFVPRSIKYCDEINQVAMKVHIGYECEANPVVTHNIEHGDWVNFLQGECVVFKTAGVRAGYLLLKHKIEEAAGGAKAAAPRTASWGASGAIIATGVTALSVAALTRATSGVCSAHGE